MSIESELKERSGSVCELCGGNAGLSVYEVPPATGRGAEGNVLTCEICLGQIQEPETVTPNHWRCLNDSMWSEVPGVQVVAWRMLDRLRGEGWPVDLLDMLYLDDATKEWAELGGGANIKHIDSNGNVLQNGDSVTLTQSLNVKGANFTAKRGTAVRNISLVHDNPEHIEGRVEGQKIVILTKFVKKSK